MKELIFIYNTQSGLTQAAVDWAHKIVSPQTYDCTLCTLTYGNIGKYISWDKFLKSISIKKSFWYKDQFEKNFPYKDLKLPCVYIKEKNVYRELISRDKMSQCNDVEDLIILIKKNLNT